MHMHSFPYPYVLVFGAARSGVGAAHLLRHYGVGVTVVDEKAAKEFRSLIRRFQRLGVTWYFGGWDKKAFEQVKAVVVSPGIRLYTDLRFSPFGSAFLADAILVQRYVEIAGQFKRVFSIVKVRGSDHSKDIRLFDISDQGIVIGECLAGYDGTMTGHPTVNPWLEQPPEGGHEQQ